MTHSSLSVLLCLAATLAGCTRSDRSLIVDRGSTTMLEIAQVWAELYTLSRPEVHIAVNGGGSTGGLMALLEGTADMANCSRRARPRERELARERGFELVEHHVGWDGVAIWVHRDNPLPSVTIAQLREIYAEGGTITRWSQLGVTLPGAQRDEIIAVGRQTNSGTYAWFRDAVLGPGDRPRLGTIEPSSSKEVVAVVGRTASAIGYSGLAFAAADTRPVPLAGEDGTITAPTIDAIVERRYPLARPLLVYTAGPPRPPVADYLEWILSDDGQRVLLRNGYPPLRKL